MNEKLKQLLIVRMFTKKLDSVDFTKVLKSLNAIDCQVLNRL